MWTHRFTPTQPPCPPSSTTTTTTAPTPSTATHQPRVNNASGHYRRGRPGITTTGGRGRPGITTTGWTCSGWPPLVCVPTVPGSRTALGDPGRAACARFSVGWGTADASPQPIESPSVIASRHEPGTTANLPNFMPPPVNDNLQNQYDPRRLSPYGWRSTIVRAWHPG
jgi:hypothetical protein